MENIFGRKIVDKLVRKQLSISMLGGESSVVELKCPRTGYAALVLPFVTAFDGTGIQQGDLTRFKIGLKFRNKDKDEYWLGDSTDISLINQYFSLENAKPLLLGDDETFEITAAQDSSLGVAGGSFTAITVEIMFVLTYITKEEYQQLNRRS